MINILVLARIYFSDNILVSSNSSLTALIVLTLYVLTLLISGKEFQGSNAIMDRKKSSG